MLIKVKKIEGGRALCEDADGNESELGRALGGPRPGNAHALLPGDVLELLPDGQAVKLHDGSQATACLFVTNRCNSNCVMCPDSDKARARRLDIDAEFLAEFVRLLPTDLPHLDVTGGEPTLIRYELPRLLNLAFSHFEAVSVMLLTNGRAFADPQYAEAFGDFRDRELVIEIPIHGDTAGLHDHIAGCPGSFRQTMAGIRNLLHAGCRVGIRIVVSMLNIDCLDQIVGLVGREFPETAFVNLMGLEMLGNARLNREQVWVEFDEAKPALERCAELCFRQGIEPRFYNFPLCLFETRFWSLYRKSISPHKVCFLEACEGCGMRDHCGGFFRSTAAMTKFGGRRECR